MSQLRLRILFATISFLNGESRIPLNLSDATYKDQVMVLDREYNKA